jgi:uncharacterized damage-inducible protein DinB
MSIAGAFWAELEQESANTSKLLAAVPFDQASFKPHEKSMSLLALASHVAEINGWWKECLVQDELDFSKDAGPRKEYHFAKSWSMRNGEVIYFTLPKSAVVRTWCLNHLYHHRGQLTVYLRLLNIPVPGMYGPTADGL